jgi:plastocyanin
MADETVFYILGGALVVLALVVSSIGVRGKSSFPSSRGAMAGGLSIVGALVIATGAYAVQSAREEQQHREDEQAEEEAHATEEAEQDGAGDAGGTEELAVSSPEDGSLAYEPPALQSAPATITLAYDNPSPVIHNINLEVEGETIAESEDVTGAATEITAELAPGEYLYYCSIPGHRDGGMEGVLNVE